MTNADFNFNFNNDGKQRTFEVIPDNTICTVQLTVRPGGVGPGGWLTCAKDGNSQHLYCEFAVLDGPNANRKFWLRYTVIGNNHADAIDISRKTLRAILESARGVRPDDKSEAAKLARHPQGWQDFDQLRFVVRVGVEPPKDGYAAKNTIREIITPDRQGWKKVEQVDRSLNDKPATNTPTATTAAQPANVIARPLWAD
jgi:hypothetical protein